ncbi:MAG TPA: cytochrome c [Pseudolabrys sp.]|nr:cytochrome c [Pseudolabrys sp.]
MPKRGGSLPIYVSSSAATDGNVIARRNNSSHRCKKPSYNGSLGRARIAPILIIALVTAQQAIAQSPRRGEELLTQNCASCHAIGRNGESPNKSAPAFRSLGQRYPIESLEEALGEGIMSGHPDMPEFTFDAKDVGAIIAYLKSIQQR